MTSDAPLAPDFIRFLLSSKPKFDCHFVVGNKSQEKPERIGAVKLMLMAHSEVFRLQLEDSDLAEKGDVPVEDVHPGTFKGMLKYVYGHDTTSDLCFDEADDMLYVAEKYMIKALKEKLAVRLMKLLNPDNICSLLNNPACYTHLELDSAITKILRYETDHVLASTQFLWVNTDGFLKILEQDALAVPEIELWRAAIKWAKHRAGSDEGQLLRQELTPHVKHIRFCAMNEDELYKDVITTQVLTPTEFLLVCQSVGLKQQQDELTEICKTIEPRSGQWSEPMEACVDVSGFQKGSWTNTSFILSTSEFELELIHFEFEFPDCKPQSVEIVQQGTDVSTPPIIIQEPDFVQQRDDCFQTCLVKDGENVRLLPKTRYNVVIRYAGKKSCYYEQKTMATISNQYFSMDLAKVYSIYYVCHFKKLVYRVK